MTEGEGQSRPKTAASRLDAFAARIPLALAFVVLLGALLRIALELSYTPAALSSFDVADYIQMADGGMFDDPTDVAGYSIFLDVLHAVSANLERTIELQHVIGLITGVLLYATVRRVGAPVWVALIGACAVLLSLDQIALEHTLASEAPFTLAYVGALYAAIRALDPGRPLAGPIGTRAAWLAAAGLALGISLWIKGTAVPLIVFFALWAAFAIPGGRSQRLGRAALAGAPAIALLLVYMTLNQSASGTFGLIQADGWSIYARTAPFADCSQFSPPEGTEELCETSPASERPAADYYSSTGESPAYQAFGSPPSGDQMLGEFGRAAAWSQPDDYLWAVASDSLRHFFPDLNAGRPFVDVGFELEIGRRNPELESELAEKFPGYYDPVGAVEVSGFAGTLADLQQVLRVHPFLLLQAALLAAVGFGFAGPRVRAAIALLAGSALVLLVASATATYSARAGVPVGGPMMAAGALGLWVLLARYRAGAPGRAPGR